MKIKDVLQRDPAAYPLVNQGHARIADIQSFQAQKELYEELSVFVCEGEYASGIEKIIRSFIDNIDRTSQRAAWVSGFFGSGKSHFLKMLSHLWQDTPFPDGATARSLVPSMPSELRDLLRELDVAVKRSGGVLAAAGALPGGTTDNVRLTILSILLNAVGLPPQYPQARFCLWLHSINRFEKVRDLVSASGKAFERELNDLYVSRAIARAVISAEPEFATGEAEAKQLLKAQFPPQTSDITTADFLRTIQDALRLRSHDEQIPCTLLVLDEVQQYIGDSIDRAVLVTEVAEAVSKQLNSRVIIAGAGQSALSDVPLLQRLMDRFTIRVQLSDSEVETVTRKVLLQKKPSERHNVQSEIDAHAGEISRQLNGTKIAESTEDRRTIVDDYPLLPVRRRFWEQCFRQIDAAGTQSQLRSQLRIIHDAVAKISDRSLSTVVPGDELFDALAPEMVNTGVLMREINERILKTKDSHGILAQRICGLVFLIGKLKREAGADTGVRASAEHLADLLIDDLAADNSKLRAEVGRALQNLVHDAILMQVGDEYRLQTREASEWDRDFRARQARLNNDDATVQFKLQQLLYTEVAQAIKSIKVVQGSAKVPRRLLLHRDQTPPAMGSDVPVWVRDGWSCSDKDVVKAAREASTESPILFAFVPRQSAEDVRRLIVEAEAAQQTLNEKGTPTTVEGQEARQSIKTRFDIAVEKRDGLIRDIVSNTRVFQGGGAELLNATLNERLRQGVDASLIRLFPHFKDADSNAWEAAVRHARDGSDHPLKVTGHSEATEKHPVCRQVISTIGSGKTGSDVRKELMSAPFGWPQDAIDAAMIALHRGQHIAATINGAVVAPGQLDQNKIAKAMFRVEQATLSVNDRLQLRKLFQILQIRCNPGEEAVRAPEFLSHLIKLASAAGGEPPLPPAPGITSIEDVQNLIGNEQLAAIREKAPLWEQDIKQWRSIAALIQERWPSWAVTERLANHALSIPDAQAYIEQIEAIKRGRLLLDESDPVNIVRLELARVLRERVQHSFEALEAAVAKAITALRGSELWNAIAPSDQESISRDVGLVPVDRPHVGTDEQLIQYLDRHPISNLQTQLDAIAGRLAQAIERAAKLLEPQVQTVSVERVTLRSTDEMERWLSRQRAIIVEALGQGPVLVN